MQYTRLGASELQISRLGLGCMGYGAPYSGAHNWVLDEAASAPFFKKAIDNGINFFDTGNNQSDGQGEEVLGRAIRRFGTREDVIISTKVFYPTGKGDLQSKGGLSRSAIMYEIDQTLKRLGTDYIDLYQMHRWDPRTPIEETLEALHDVVKAGKARFLGASTMLPEQFMKAYALQKQNGWTTFIAISPHYNLIYREDESLLPFCLANDIAVLPWSPLARGRLARPLVHPATQREQNDGYARTLYDRNADKDGAVIEALARVAAQRELPMAQIALAWLLHQPAVTAPSICAIKPHHFTDAIAALALQLTDDEMAALTRFYQPHELVGVTASTSDVARASSNTIKGSKLKL